MHAKENNLNPQNGKYFYDKKREYLIKTLSRTKRKDYENYIVNAIYHKLDRLDVQPVTQQYVKRSDGRYALIDLYFPQLNYGIECDEAYHIDNNENDSIRVLTMEDMLDSVDETKGFILRRIRAYEDIESINNQIIEVVNELKSLLEIREIDSWDIYRDPSEYAMENRIIRVEDRLQFDTIVNLSKCFGREYKNMQRSYFNVGHGYYIWCPKLAIIIDGEERAVSNGWINNLSDDWNTIYERNENLADIKLAAHRTDIKRLIFAKSKDTLGRNTYRFIGVFVYSKEQSTQSQNVYVREATAIDLEKWLS